MTNYSVVVEHYGYTTVEVEADSPEEASRIAEEQTEHDDIPLGPVRADEVVE